MQAAATHFESPEIFRAFSCGKKKEYKRSEKMKKELRRKEDKR